MEVRTRPGMDVTRRETRRTAPAVALVAAVAMACAAWVSFGGAGQGRTVLSMHMRGHDLGAAASAAGGLRSTASHHASAPGAHPPPAAVAAAVKAAKPAPVVKLTPKQIHEEKVGVRSFLRSFRWPCEQGALGVFSSGCGLSSSPLQP